MLEAELPAGAVPVTVPLVPTVVADPGVGGTTGVVTGGAAAGGTGGFCSGGTGGPGIGATGGAGDGVTGGPGIGATAGAGNGVTGGPGIGATGDGSGVVGTTIAFASVIGCEFDPPATQPVTVSV